MRLGVPEDRAGTENTLEAFFELPLPLTRSTRIQRQSDRSHRPGPLFDGGVWEASANRAHHGVRRPRHWSGIAVADEICEIQKGLDQFTHLDVRTLGESGRTPHDRETVAGREQQRLLIAVNREIGATRLAAEFAHPGPRKGVRSFLERNQDVLQRLLQRARREQLRAQG